MLKRHSEFLKSLLFLFDLTIIATCWLASYYIRFHVDFIPVTKGVPPIGPYLWLLIPIVFVWGVSFQAFNLYRPRRIGSHMAEVLDIAKANTISVLVLVALTFFLKQFEYSRLALMYFWSLNLVVLGCSRMVFRELLRFLRRRGYNQRHALIVGAGRLAQKLVESIRQRPELGFQIRGYLTRRPEKLGKTIAHVPVIGTFENLSQVVESGIDIVFVCLPPDAEVYADKILSYLATTQVDVKIIPAIYEFMVLRAEAEMFDGLPLITLQGTPLYGWNVVLKRGMDIVGAAIALVGTGPLFLVITAAIKLTSPGPVLYRQIRMGLDGQAFEMLKFRTMKVDAEARTGAVWARPDDDRQTLVGAFLRKSSLDEVPQFWNVLKGQMSIVGPRPERPELIRTFRQQFPQYMLRHKMKAGITGWAQVNGWRGNTSLEKRLEYDLYYIEHWSPWFDVKIMLMTLWKGFVHKHTY